MTGPTHPTDPSRGLAGGEAARRSLRRATARQLHPDLGGDPDDFDRAMRALEAAGPPPPAGPRHRRSAGGSATNPVATIRTTPRSRAVRRITASGRQLVHTIRTRIPRSLPGSRRYGHL